MSCGTTLENVLARCRVKAAPEITGSPSYVMVLENIQKFALRIATKQWTLNFNEQKCTVISVSPKSPAAISLVVNQFINKIIIETWVSLCLVISAGVPTTVIFCPMPTKCFIYTAMYF